jgi:hypothetical protein
MLIFLLVDFYNNEQLNQNHNQWGKISPDQQHRQEKR